MTTIYKCFKSDFPELEKKINRIIKKLDKHNLNHDFKILGESIEEASIIDYVNHDNIPSWQFTPKNLGKKPFEVVSYTFTMDSLKLGEYEAIAVIEHGYNENKKEPANIIHIIKEDSIIPIPYRIAKSICQHCNSDRHRNKTVLLKDNTGDMKQVGTTCIREYTGIEGIDIIRAYQEIHDICLTSLSMDYGNMGSSYTRYEKTIDYLAACIECIKNHGYQNSESKQPTKYKAWEIAGIDNQNKEYFAIAEKVINYFISNNFEESQNFLNNIKVLLSNEYCKVSGIIAYSFIAYEKQLEYEAKKKAEAENKKQSEYIGSIGEKIQIELKLNKVITYETMYGIQKMYFFEDSDGNIYKWNSSNRIEKEEGENLKLKGTIKTHEEYNSQKQTVLTRCKVI